MLDHFAKQRSLLYYGQLEYEKKLRVLAFIELIRRFAVLQTGCNEYMAFRSRENARAVIKQFSSKLALCYPKAEAVRKMARESTVQTALSGIRFVFHKNSDHSGELIFKRMTEQRSRAITVLRILVLSSRADKFREMVLKKDAFYKVRTRLQML